MGGKCVFHRLLFCKPGSKQLLGKRHPPPPQHGEHDNITVTCRDHLLGCCDSQHYMRRGGRSGVRGEAVEPFFNQWSPTSCVSRSVTPARGLRFASTTSSRLLTLPLAVIGLLSQLHGKWQALVSLCPQLARPPLMLLRHAGLGKQTSLASVVAMGNMREHGLLETVAMDLLVYSTCRNHIVYQC